MKITQCLLIMICGSVLLASCGTAGKLTTTSVVYQSVKTRHAQPTEEFLNNSEEIKIVVGYYISSEGQLVPIVYNRTSEIMIIDQTMSFFVNSDGLSTSFYDPTVRTTSTTDVSSSTSGASVNLGSIAGALGIGGTLGQLANGINVGGAGTSGTATTNTTYKADLPKLSIGPHGNCTMKVFSVKGIGKGELGDMAYSVPEIQESDSYCSFRVCISYSIDGGQTFEKLTTNFYADSRIVVPVERRGRTNDALRKIFTIKPNALYEPWWCIAFNNNASFEQDCTSEGIMWDYQ